MDAKKNKKTTRIMDGSVKDLLYVISDIYNVHISVKPVKFGEIPQRHTEQDNLLTTIASDRDNIQVPKSMLHILHLIGGMLA